MNQLFGAQSPLMIAVRKMLDVLLVNFLWIIVSIPVVTVGASTAAWYDVVYKDIRHGRGNAFFDFFHAFRANFRQAFPAGAVFAVFSILLWLDIGLLHHLGTQGSPWGDLWALVLIVFAFAVIYFLWLSAYIARFRLGLREMALNALKLLIAHLPAALLTGLVTGGCVLAIWLWPGTLFFLPTVGMLMCSFLLERVFRRYMTEEERRTEDERNRSWRLYRKKAGQKEPLSRVEQN